MRVSAERVFMCRDFETAATGKARQENTYVDLVVRRIVRMDQVRRWELIPFRRPLSRRGLAQLN